MSLDSLEISSGPHRLHFVDTRQFIKFPPQMVGTNSNLHRRVKEGSGLESSAGKAEKEGNAVRLARVTSPSTSPDVASCLPRFFLETLFVCGGQNRKNYRRFKDSYCHSKVEGDTVYFVDGNIDFSCFRKMSSERVDSSPNTLSPTQRVQFVETSTGSDQRRFQSRSVENDTCYLCHQKGHWSRDCPLKSMRKSIPLESSLNSVDDPDFPPKRCPCGGGFCRILTSKTERNPGRKFYSCPATGCRKCDFFEWCDTASFDQSLDVANPPYPMCPCGAGVCKIFTAKERRNAGRKFFVCAVKKGQGACNFFQWQDSLGKDCDMIHGLSHESIQVNNSCSILNGEKDIGVATDCKEGGDGFKLQALCCNGSHEERPLLSMCDEGFRVEEETKHLLIEEFGLRQDWEKYINELEELYCSGIMSNRPSSSSGESSRDSTWLVHAPRAIQGQGACGFFAWQDSLSESNDTKDSLSDESMSLNYSRSISDSENDPLATTGYKQGQEGCNLALFSGLLEKGSSSSCDERFSVEEETEKMVIENLSLYEAGEADLKAPSSGFGKGPLVSPSSSTTIEGFQVEVGHHPLIKRRPNLHEVEDQNCNGPEDVFLNRAEKKELSMSPSKECRVEGTDQHPVTEKPESHREAAISAVAQLGKCFRCGKEGHLTKECARSLICFKCGKVGHQKKDCTS